MRARAQGESYARALPASEGRPPFVLVVDVGHVIEVFSEFTAAVAHTPRSPTRAATASNSMTCARMPSGSDCGRSGSIR